MREIEAGARFRSTASSRGRVLLPLSVDRLPGGVWLHSSCRMIGILAQELTGRLASLDIRLVPGTDRTWDSPLPREELVGWLDETARHLGQAITAFAVQLPSDPRRMRFGLLLLGDGRIPVAFAKFTRNPPRPSSIAVQRALTEKPPAFWFPALVRTGELAGWSFEVTEALPNVPHRPARLDPEERLCLVREFHRCVETADWVGEFVVHADFAPWNVRRLRDGRIAVIDWEEATSGPVAADELWHAVTWAVTRGKASRHVAADVGVELTHHDPSALASAAAFWLDRHTRPEPEEIDESVEQRVPTREFALRVLEAMRMIRREAETESK